MTEAARKARGEAWCIQYATELLHELRRAAVSNCWTVGQYIACLARAGFSDDFLKQEVARLT